MQQQQRHSSERSATYWTIRVMEAVCAIVTACQEVQLTRINEIIMDDVPRFISKGYYYPFRTAMEKVSLAAVVEILDGGSYTPHPSPPSSSLLPLRVLSRAAELPDVKHISVFWAMYCCRHVILSTCKISDEPTTSSAAAELKLMASVAAMGNRYLVLFALHVLGLNATRDDVASWVYVANPHTSSGVMTMMVIDIMHKKSMDDLDLLSCVVKTFFVDDDDGPIITAKNQLELELFRLLLLVMECACQYQKLQHQQSRRIGCRSKANTEMLWALYAVTCSRNNAIKERLTGILLESVRLQGAIILEHCSIDDKMTTTTICGNTDEDTERRYRKILKSVVKSIKPAVNFMGRNKNTPDGDLLTAVAHLESSANVCIYGVAEYLVTADVLVKGLEGRLNDLKNNARRRRDEEKKLRGEFCPLDRFFGASWELCVLGLRAIIESVTREEEEEREQEDEIAAAKARYSFFPMAAAAAAAVPFRGSTAHFSFSLGSKLRLIKANYSEACYDVILSTTFLQMSVRNFDSVLNIVKKKSSTSCDVWKKNLWTTKSIKLALLASFGAKTELLKKRFEFGVYMLHVLLDESGSHFGRSVSSSSIDDVITNAKQRKMFALKVFDLLSVV